MDEFHLVEGPYESELKGTTFKVYRFLIRQRVPVGISQVQKALGLSSSSVAEYHIRKLIRLGLAREEGAGYVVDRVVLDNIVRIRKFSIPIQSAYISFFAVTLFILVALLRPVTIDSRYFLALSVNCVALGISIFEALKTLRYL